MSGQVPTILCVEDEADLLDDLASELREAGYTVIEAADGLSALTAITLGGIDLVLCDVQLPGIDGLGILRRLRENAEAASSVRFALVTAYSDSHLRAEAEALAVDALIVKPIDYDQLLELVPRLLAGD